MIVLGSSIVDSLLARNKWSKIGAKKKGKQIRANNKNSFLKWSPNRQILEIFFTQKVRKVRANSHTKGAGCPQAALSLFNVRFSLVSVQLLWGC